jgi:cysteine desulfurase/selenocysteine lyase
MKSIDSIRADFPFLERLINGRKIAYFDNAATTQKPRRVITAVCDFYANHCANVHRGAHRLSEEASELYESVRGRVARFLGSDEQEIVFVRNATEAINLVSRSLQRPGDILVPVSEHHSNLLPWRQARSVRPIGIDREGRIDLEDLRRKLTPGVALVAVAHVTNVLGTVNPVKEIVELASANGSLTLIDASQSVAHLPVDVRALGCDFLVFSGHKMFAPSGIGVLFARGEALEELSPYQVGGGTVKSIDRDTHLFKEIPWCFEAGTPNIEGTIALGAAIDYIEGLGFPGIIEHERRLLAHTLEGLHNIGGVSIHSPARLEDGLCSAIAFSLPRIDSQVVARILSDRLNVMVRSGFHCANPLHAELRLAPTVRASYSVYNTVAEIDLMLDCLGSLRQIA